MSFDVSPIAGFPAAASPVDRTRPSGPNEKASFTDAAAAARTAPAIPAEVWDQVDAASRLAQNLHDQGQSVRFDVHKLDGGVVASLVDEDGGLLRPLLLDDVVDIGRLTRKLGQGNS
jgi:hypothetical protein